MLETAYSTPLKPSFERFQEVLTAKLLPYGMRIILLLASLVGILCASAQGPQLPLTSSFSWPGTTSYNESIPTPTEVLGFAIGETHTTPHQVERYFRAVAAASPRVKFFIHGYTYEGRPLIHAVVGTPERIGNLDQIKAKQRSLFSDPATITDEALNAMPAVAYMGYTVHGNEASGTEAALLTLYHLAAGEGPAVEEVLNNTIVLIDPILNPDGRDRFADWVNRNRGGAATIDPQDREHREAWPNGRTNHYWFDLNRDWLPAQHPESQARLKVFYDWQPQVLTDFHEMGSNATYFFQPGIPSRTNPQTSQLNQQLTGQLTDYCAESLDAIGSLYYTRESFDDFYYGKGSTYPDINGSVGILFEQASSRALKRKVGNKVLTYGFSIRNQLVSSLSVLQGTAAMRKTLVAYTRDFYAGSSAFAKTKPFSAYFLPFADQKVRVLELAKLLSRHQISSYINTEAIAEKGIQAKASSGLLIPLDQPQARLLLATFEPTTEFKDSLFYDVTTWSLPLAFDVVVHKLNTRSKQLSKPYNPLLEESRLLPGKLYGEPASAYAYVFAYSGYNAPQAVYHLLAKGVDLRLAHEPLSVTVGTKTYNLPRGTIIIPNLQNRVPESQLLSYIRKLPADYGIDVYASTTGLTAAGPDLGGRSTEVLHKPKLALLTGPGASAYDAGEAWHLLSERLKIPVSLLEVPDFDRFDLSGYTHIIATGGRYSGLDVDKLKAWISAGGNLVASHTAAPWVVDKKLAKLEEVSFNMDSLLKDLPFAQLDEARGAQYIGGSIFEVSLDNTHPLAYGLKSSLPLFRKHTRFFQQPTKPGLTVGTYPQQPLLSGYLSGPRAQQAAGALAVAELQRDRGRITLIFDNPNFRAFWRGSERLWLNALILR